MVVVSAVAQRVLWRAAQWDYCRHKYTRVTQFCASCREVTWSQLRGRGQATPVEEEAFDLDLRDEQGCGQMKAR